jgi:hypothetical protein
VDDDEGGKIVAFPHRIGKPSKSDVLALVADGWRHIDIAAKHDISTRTIGRYVAEARNRRVFERAMAATA